MEHSNEGFRGVKPIRVTGEAAKKLLDEINNPKPLSDKQKALFKEIREMHKRSEIRESFDKTLGFIQEGHYSKEQLQSLLEAIQKRNDE